MCALIRPDAVAYERHLIYFATILGVLALYGGLVITLTGGLISLNPLTNPTGVLGVVLLLYALPYLAGAAVLARTRSITAWGFLMTVFVVGSVAGAVFVTPESLLTGVVGLYIGYRAARDGDYDVPLVGSPGA